uniref:Uncharacterized protein n=1 Tax=Aegilops tauschii subsp. strangulata TaxID=200361 RepID=A0A453EP05_AEGTS
FWFSNHSASWALDSSPSAVSVAPLHSNPPSTQISYPHSPTGQGDHGDHGRRSLPL